MNKLLTSGLAVSLLLMLVACTGGTVTETVTSTQTVNSIQTTTQSSTIQQELSTSEIVERINPAVAYIENSYGIGTGTVIDVRGYVLTNNHVVAEENYALVRLPDKQDVIAEVVYRDVNLDIAILKCSGTGYSHIALGSVVESDLGDDVTAFGHPVGEGESVSISKGIISSYRTFDGVKYIQTDAAANPGSSGGPLINNYGEFIGIISWGFAETEGLNFAIEVNNIRVLLEDILQQLTQGGILTETVTQIVTRTVTTTVGGNKTVTMTATTTVGVGQTATETTTVSESRFVCPIDGMEFDTLAELQAHFEAVHSGETPQPTTTITVTTTATVTPTTTTPSNVVFSVTGVGKRNTLQFSISTSPWMIQYTTDWTGNRFGVAVAGDATGTVINNPVVAGEINENYIYGKTGTMYFIITDAPVDGTWTITVIDIS